MQPIRHGLLCALTAASAFSLLVAAPALAQNYPSRAIRVIVPFPAGGGTDIIAREVVNKVATTQG